MSLDCASARIRRGVGNADPHQSHQSLGRFGRAIQQEAFWPTLRGSLPLLVAVALVLVVMGMGQEALAWSDAAAQRGTNTVNQGFPFYRLFLALALVAAVIIGLVTQKVPWKILAGIGVAALVPTFGSALLNSLLSGGNIL